MIWVLIYWLGSAVVFTVYDLYRDRDRYPDIGDAAFSLFIGLVIGWIAAPIFVLATIPLAIVNLIEWRRYR